MGINIDEIGKVNFKTQWKEEDAANINDVIDTYNYVKKLIIKINDTLKNHPRKVYIKVPEDYEFRFSFINCIQRFNLPDNKIIDHNDFSDFCIFFYPYISLVIEPRKRLGKITSSEAKSKYGSYLRYKRVSKFENQAKIEHKILSYLKNYDFEDDVLSEEISKQFNITIEKSKEEINRVRNKFPNIIKNNKNLLKLSEELPKNKAPGIGIDIQGKIPEKYKIRISGAKNQSQLERILLFMNILLYLYAETYLLKNPKYQVIKDKLKKITNIAKRRNKVNDVYIAEKEIKTIKHMSQIDKKRIGFTPEEGMSQYSRYCQNSGDDKKRRPQQTVINNISQLIANGYRLNKKTGEYEKKVILKKKGSKHNEVILKAIKITDKDENTGAANDILYTCDPEDNGEHMYVGFLTRSNNPFGECMPCCFKKNPLITKKKEKQDFYKRCLSGNTEKLNENTSGFTGDILYILQDTNKIQEGRIAYLPKYIDFITNLYLKKNKEVKNHYLLKTNSFFFKYGINQENYSFLNTLSAVLKMPISDIKSIITNFFKNDVDENYYFSLNDGDIRAEYKINDFIRFINDEQFIDFYYLKDILKIEKLFTKNGILPIVFNKSQTVIKTGIEKEKIKEDFYLLIDKSNIVDYNHYLNMFQEKDILILIKDGKFYYPLVEISKLDENTKDISIKKLFNKNTKNNIDDNNFIDLIINFYSKTIDDINIDLNKTHTSARETYILMNKLNDSKYEVTHQVVDSRYKTKYLITKNNYTIPVIPSGIIDKIPIICLNSTEYNKIDCFSKLTFFDIEKTNFYLEELYKISNKKINVKPIGLFYDKIDDNNMLNVIGIITSNNDFVPINSISISKDNLDNNKIIYQHRPLYHKLDQKLAFYDKNNLDVIDERIKNVNKNKYIDEAYQLFKFELSNIISSKNFTHIKSSLKEFIKLKDSNKIQTLINSLCTNNIDNKIYNKDNSIGNELVKIIKELPNLDYYKVNNQRHICESLDKNKCNLNPHCILHENNSKKPTCSFALTNNLLLQFIKRLSIEIVEQDIKAYEILKEKKYYVSDIVDYNNFTEKPGQKIIKSSNTNLQKILTDIFGKEHIPKIGRRFLNKKLDLDLHSLQFEFPLKDIKDAYVQNIIPYNYSILRAYINGFYWIKHDLYTIDNRNLGYYSDLQNELVNMFRAFIIDWLNIPNNISLLMNLNDNAKNIIKNKILFVENKNNKIVINNYIINFMESTTENNLGLFELFVLYHIHKIPIVILINNNLKYLINNNINTFDDLNSNSNNESKYLNSNNICINLDISNQNVYPNIVEIIYYK